MKRSNKKIKGFTPHYFSNKNGEGFTLVEVMIVVTIMALIIGIVMISVGSARDKAKDAAIKANLSGMRSEGENYATDNPGVGYTDFCNDGKTMEYRNAVLALNREGVGCAEEAEGKEWAACADLVYEKGSYWCVDWQANAKKIDGDCDPVAWSATGPTTCP